MLETAPERLISDALRQKILQAIESTSVSLQTASAPRQEVLQAPITGDKFDGKIKHYAPKLNLGRWNFSPTVQSSKNCYNYANDKITDSYAQPGTASGAPFKSITAKAMLRASESDGLVKLDVAPKDSCPKAPQQPKCLVALVVAEG